jgi:hypothetical protein
MYAQAVAQSEQLLTVNKESPYIDLMLILAAACEVRRGKADRASATLQSLLKNYPGSPSVPEIKGILKPLEAGETDKVLALLDGLVDGTFKNRDLDDTKKPTRPGVKTPKAR